jgi:iron complex outermembrane receptor protein
MKIYIRALVLFLITWTSISQAQHTLVGNVYTEKGEPLNAAVILIQGTQNTAVTDERGRFEIDSLPHGKCTVEITFLGFEKLVQTIELDKNKELDFIIKGKLYNLDRIEITANRADTQAPFTYVNVTEKELNRINLGQDMPFLLDGLPSTVVTSDAGAGIGYTGIRIRGSDPTRVNVTINDVPLNDAESQSVFWVNLPDLASSVNEIQVQRGVGPSTNGPGAYGGSIGINTKEVRINPYIDFFGSLGSFNTKKYSVSLGTGLMNNKYSIDMRYSNINSDGYVDRASSDLSSYYISLSKVSEKSSLRFITFSGRERTYQSWYGVPESKVNGNLEALQQHYNNNVGSIYNTQEDSLNLFNSDRRYNYYRYDNQVDDYRQTHYQLHYAKNVNEKFTYKTTLFYTRGAGFFEEYKHQDALKDYSISDFEDENGHLVTNSDLVRRRWLDNDLFGLVFNTNYKISSNTDFSAGGSFSRYIGDHFGRVEQLFVPTFFDPLRNYYENTGKKNDGNIYSRFTYQPSEKYNAYLDLQGRVIGYNASGDDNGGALVNIDTTFIFFNPKAGISLNTSLGLVYASAAFANKEPSRSDFIDNPRYDTPDHESLIDYELGIRSKGSKHDIGANFYFMDYINQLIQTGDLNDVGAVIRTNVADSYRMGIEIDAGYQFNAHFAWSWDLNLSRNKIDEFNEVLFDYTNGFERIETTFQNTDIAFSPNIIFRNEFIVSLVKNLLISLETKYVGDQYLDNTQNEGRKLDAFLVNKLRFNYELNPKFAKKVDFTLSVNNLLDAKYSANGYTYSYIFGETITENFLYPQAGIHFLLGMNIKL